MDVWFGVGEGVDEVAGGDRELDRRGRFRGGCGGAVGLDRAPSGRASARCFRRLRPRDSWRSSASPADGGMGATPPRRLPAPGLGAGVTDDGALPPGVLAGAAVPVVDVDVLADDRAAGVAGVERARGPERVGLDVDVAAERDQARVDGDLERGRPGGEVQAGRGDAVALDAAPRRPVGGREPGPCCAGAPVLRRSAGSTRRRLAGARAATASTRAARARPRASAGDARASAFMRARPRAMSRIAKHTASIAKSMLDFANLVY